ncbi:MAG: lactate utilization protein [Pirellulales bacterium]
MSREVFLKRVREAAAAGRAYRVHPNADVTRAMGRAAHEENLVAEYVTEVSKAGGRPVVVVDRAAAREELQKLFHLYEPRSALCWRHPVLDRLGLAEFLQGQRIERIDAETTSALSHEAARAKWLAADIGITSADCAVAETGSLLMAHAASNERVASLLPPVYVAVVERAQIVPDLFDVVERFATKLPANLPSNLTFITGPSKTGDIESKLVTGVHGPGKWHVIVIDAD